MDLEEDLKRQLCDRSQAPIVLALGIKGGGKTYKLNQMIRWCMANECYDVYFLILPVYKFEADDSYAYLKDKRITGKAKVFVAPEYGNQLSTSIMSRKDDENSPRIMIWLDDLAAGAYSRLVEDEAFVALISIARHKKVSIVICYHSLTSGGPRGVLNPFVRANITHLFLYKLTNTKLLESIYEEFLSLVPEFKNFNDFKRRFVEHTFVNTESEKYKSLCIALQHSQVDWNLKEWFTDATGRRGKAGGAARQEAQVAGGLAGAQAVSSGRLDTRIGAGTSGTKRRRSG